LNNAELEKIEKYYEEVAEAGANEYQIEQSKEESAKMNAILGDPKRLKTLAEDFCKTLSKQSFRRSNRKR
jgi:type I restriction enzyme R subunit